MLSTIYVMKYNAGMNKYDQPNSTYWLLLQILLRSKHKIGAIAEGRGLTGMQAHAMSLLSTTEPQAMNGLSVQLGCDASNVTGIVDRLENAELVERNDNPQDRRIKSVVLTPKGVELREQFYADLQSVEASELAALSETEQQEFHRLLAKLLAKA